MAKNISTEMMKGTVVPVTLKLLSERSMYGYEIIKEVNQRTDNVLNWKEATLYPWLHRLEQQGLIQSNWVQHPGSRKRKYYEITKKGLATLKTQCDEWHELSRVVTALLTPLASTI